MVVFQDITEIKALEERLRQADRLAALGTLSAGLAHEIKNPLSAIKTFVQLLPRKLQSPSFMEKFNITVPREIDRINYLVEDLLELTRKKDEAHGQSGCESLDPSSHRSSRRRDEKETYPLRRPTGAEPSLPSGRLRDALSRFLQSSD